MIKKTNCTESEIERGRLAYIIDFFNETHGTTYNVDDLALDLRNENETATAYVRGWRDAMKCVRIAIDPLRDIDDVSRGEITNICQFIESNL